jgi:hypothetical protein
MLTEFISDNVGAGHLPNTGLRTYTGSASLLLAQQQIPVAARYKAWVWSRSLLGIWVRIPPKAWMCLSLVSVVCIQVEVMWRANHSSRGALQSVVSECDREASRMRPWPTGGCCEMKKWHIIEYLQRDIAADGGSVCRKRQCSKGKMKVTPCTKIIACTSRRTYRASSSYHHLSITIYHQHLRTMLCTCISNHISVSASHVSVSTDTIFSAPSVTDNSAQHIK